MPCPLHCPGHPPLGHLLGIDDDAPLLEGDLITVHSSVVKLGYVLGATLDGRGEGKKWGGVGRGGEERGGRGSRMEWDEVGAGRGVGWSGGGGWEGRIGKGGK